MCTSFDMFQQQSNITVLSLSFTNFIYDLSECKGHSKVTGSQAHKEGEDPRERRRSIMWVFTVRHTDTKRMVLRTNGNKNHDMKELLFVATSSHGELKWVSKVT
ncbi:hypothetical protein AVEN_200013-1 [Araneus ventricosus]|uniref:Uncharacterized protein n=1 Tax=Araneus ventricosus TaxID=182803 RepID=A0A4Y2UYC2_ARAVE|nr:hypothetical protein AVEN_200013-1 [Araneus ventricosus]